ncbi:MULTISPECIES: CheR family methyltransferase [unclassified Cupriavidus]|uniref:CheR family methyltransferase n=1 Tax=unclassified Cupriavidus TaxID=2640874 RepID=UPI001C0065BB|nr:MULTISPECIES: CheR family methyltransferase [unclassified Cupriavidus]MCA3194548.1 PAS domain S-box protein [Cupriavidus sp.]MCA3200155.1 PAS domain S-box protein [Cupriavidus sp.]MCA3204201.1 PAS domain S-box protein [Cupriavidus sp.]MCA3209337.1 PAS domain S-box protein [Cupriavidus sp.]QWE97541.1 PAS domain S-box protein [Cupriavidus sp. EM10]
MAGKKLKEKKVGNPTGAVKSTLHFPVVGLGASAGGLKALQTFFQHAPGHMNMAFVVVVHLAPDLESQVAALLQRVTTMPVSEVRATVPIQENHIYVVAPGTHIEMSDGCLRVIEQPSSFGRPFAIDHFFRTLADAHDRRAIAIVLSGSGSDGTIGLGPVREVGGLTMAQSPDDAEHPEMPRSAIAAGWVDIVLPAAEFPQRLMELWENVQRIEPQDAVLEAEAHEVGHPPRTGAERALSEILMHLRVRTGHDFRFYKRATVLRRIERRMQFNGQSDLAAYRDFLRATPDEASALLGDMLIGVTQFFRDSEAFDFLEQEMIPTLFDGKLGDDDQVRVWVAGCATGEEAYSISILLAQAREAAASARPIQVFATDIDVAAIGRARTGSYPLSIANDVPPPLLQRYFTREGAHYAISKAVRERILFAPHSLLRDPPFSHLDLISCRNVLIYLERAVQRQILELFHFALRPNGLLFLGTAESADAADDLFAVVDKKWRVYRARAVSQRAKPPIGFPVLTPADTGPTEDRPTVTIPLRATASSPQRSFSLTELHQRALETYSPPSVIIDRESNVVHLSDNAGRFLRHVGGELTTNIMTLVLPELRLDLRTAIFRALQTGTSVEARKVKWDHDPNVSWISMTVRPFHDKVANADFLLVVFDEVAGHMTEEELAAASGQDPVLAQLELELQHSREQLATIIEQYETSVEELKASNEELQAINEELRSTSEELESSKEELQSVNEELTTANAEMQARIEDTAKANDDLHNIIASSEIATVFVDKEIRIKRFTPNATAIFNLIDSDLGRSLFHITHSLRYPTLVDDVRQSFQSLRLTEREIQSEAGRWYLMRLLPYRTADDHIDGAVITLIDVTDRHQAEEAARAGAQRLRLVAQSTKDYAIIIQDREGLIVSWNAGAERIFGYTEDELVGKSVEVIYEASDRQVFVPAHERETAMKEGRADDERWYRTKDGRRVYCSGVVTPIMDTSFSGFAKIVRDLTSRKLHEDASRDALAKEQAAREQALNANQLKDEFIAVLSHELKHPLNLIGVKAEMLPRLPEVRNVAAVREAAGAIRQAVRSQAQIIDDLLDLSRVQTGKLALDVSRVDLGEMLESVARTCEQDVGDRGITMRLSLPDRPAIALVDRIRCEQILWNLVSNALKFSDKNGQIDLRLSQEGRMLRLEVSDNGQGIDAALLPYVFDMYRQGGRDRARGGLGIGLALVKQLAKMHGGRVTAKSDGLGQGTTLTVWLPAAPAEVASNADGADHTQSIAGLRILLVEGDRDTSAALAELLGLEGATVSVATSAAETLQMLGDVSVDAIVSDIGLPDMDGYALMRTIRQDSRWANVWAVALTGRDHNEDARAAREAGYNLHLAKPLDFQELLEALSDLKPQSGGERQPA